MAKISAVVLTRNEEKNIRRCLRSLLWCDEIILIDDYSSDKTLQIAKEFKAKSYKRNLNNDFSAQRNFGFNKAKGEWLLFVDADELVENNLANEIQEKIENTHLSGYLINRQDIFFGKKLTGGEWGSNYLLRLVKKGSGKWERNVHEVLKINGEAGKLSSTLLHSPSKNLFNYIYKLNFYSSLHAKSNISEGKNTNLLKIFFWPIFKFIINFVVKRGYKDGVYGFVFAILMSFHSYLSWSKQWEQQKKN